VKKDDVKLLKDVLTTSQEVAALNEKLFIVIDDQQRELKEAKQIISDLLDQFDKNDEQMKLIREMVPLSKRAGIWLENRKRQKDAAARPRADALQRLIDEILRSNPNLTAPEVVAELGRRQGDGVIETITDDEIEWSDDANKAESTPIKAVKDRVSRAKKKLSSR
jgi:hypothetical protein